MTSSFFMAAVSVLALGFAGLTHQASCHTKSNSSTNPPKPSQANEQAGTSTANGVWGGDHIRLEVSDTGATVEYDCAHGAILERLKFDSEGHFRAKGTHLREHGGPVRNDEAPVSHAAAFSGNINGNQMTLTVTLTESSERVGTFTLTRGSEGNIEKCR